MANLWIKEPEAGDPFKDFLELFDLARAGKTSNPHRLRMRLDREWDQLGPKGRKEYTDRLIEQGRIEEEIANLVRLFNGTITEIHRLV